MIRVLIVDDDPMARKCFELLVGQSDRYEFAASIGNANYAETYCASGKVDLILMDILTEDYANGLDAAEKIKQKYPRIKIIMVTSMPEYSYLDRARAIGVDSFWYKEVTKEPFISLLDRTMAGEHIFPDTTPVLKIGNARSNEFTDREVEVLKELINGKSNAEIAEKLHVSISTVKIHIQNMQDKTGFHSRTKLAVYARTMGFVIPDREDEE